jgi:predicted ABC-type ATPase
MKKPTFQMKKKISRAIENIVSEVETLENIKNYIQLCYNSWEIYNNSTKLVYLKKAKDKFSGISSKI